MKAPVCHEFVEQSASLVADLCCFLFCLCFFGCALAQTAYGMSAEEINIIVAAVCRR